MGIHSDVHCTCIIKVQDYDESEGSEVKGKHENLQFLLKNYLQPNKLMTYME